MTQVLNADLNHRIEWDGKWFALYDGAGYHGRFASEAEALRQYRAPQTNYDHASTPDGI